MESDKIDMFVLTTRKNTLEAALKVNRTQQCDITLEIAALTIGGISPGIIQQKVTNFNVLKEAYTIMYTELIKVQEQISRKQNSN